MFDIDKRSDLTVARSDILAAHMVGTWQWDIVHDRVTCDLTNAGLLGLTPREASRGVRSQRIVQAVHPDDRDRLKTATAPARNAGGMVDLVLRTTPAPDVVRRVNLRGLYEPDEHGVMVRGYGLLIDVTSPPAVAALPEEEPSSTPDEPVARSAALCRSARQVVAENGTFRLRTLLDMVLLEYGQILKRNAR